MYICRMEILFCDNNSMELKTYMEMKAQHDAENWAGKLFSLCDSLVEEKRELEAKILIFRQMLKKGCPVNDYSPMETEYWLEQYDKHFGIQILRNGETNSNSGGNQGSDDRESEATPDRNNIISNGQE